MLHFIENDFYLFQKQTTGPKQDFVSRAILSILIMQVLCLCHVITKFLVSRLPHTGLITAWCAVEKPQFFETSCLFQLWSCLFKVVSRSGRPLSEKIHFIHFYFATMTIIKLERRDVRLLLLYEFRLGQSAMEAERNICGAMGEGALSYNTAKSWFQKFKNGDFSLEEIERSGRPVELNEEDLVKLVEEEPRLSLREMEEKLECCHSTIARHLGRLGFTSKLGIWVPHELSASQKLTRVNVCTQLLTFRRKFDWLNNLVTGDEKWVLYVNHSRKRQWLPIGEKGIPTPKPDLHPKKIMICVWWGVQGPVHWELLPTNKTITADYYCAQLDRVAEKTNGKYEQLYFLHDNARPHVAKKTFQKLQDLGWTVLPHPPYSPDLAPTDYHLFLSLSDYMRDKQFDDEEHLKTELSTFFSSRSPDFFSRGIMMLPSKWQQVPLSVIIEIIVQPVTFVLIISLNIVMLIKFYLVKQIRNPPSPAKSGKNETVLTTTMILLILPIVFNIIVAFYECFDNFDYYIYLIRPFFIDAQSHIITCYFYFTHPIFIKKSMKTVSLSFSTYVYHQLYISLPKKFGKLF
nr:hypothetical protein C45H4.5 - Caenorhabditis elegans [Caenorhabditis elegans]